MKVLALETATMAGSIAVINNDVLTCEAMINVRVAHSERVMNAVDWLLKTSGISIKELDAFAVSIGPGSFTGLRIGLSTVKGLSYAANKPIVPVPTLDAFARTLSFSSHTVCPMLDARKNEVYTGLYRWEDGLFKKVLSETAVDPADFIKEIKGPAVFTGDGARIYRKLIKETLKSKALFAPPSRMYPSASTVAEVALESLKAGVKTDPLSLTPFYIRKSEAEINWKE
jgi:tRNA threonylcarbamoyladenosine biosynthesis protein TsaB